MTPERRPRGVSEAVVEVVVEKVDVLWMTEGARTWGNIKHPSVECHRNFRWEKSAAFSKLLDFIIQCSAVPASLEEDDGELGGLVDAGREGPGRQGNGCRSGGVGALALSRLRGADTILLRSSCLQGD